ncbi:hypothetical protein [Burkholderia gladioli]|uniref:hypothetical protein n=1 Tax=Burkholderia gladioli TaxID=28095 RepID=UPI001641F7FC|nr:hypothetical protein [Burkholderia gladioli]
MPCRLPAIARKPAFHFPGDFFTAHARPLPRGFSAAGRRGRPSLDDIGSAITQFLTPFSGDSIGFRAFDSRRMRDLLVAFDKKWDFGVAENRRE